MSEERTWSPAEVALAAELRIVLGQLMRRMREQVRGTDLTKSQAAVLSRLESHGATTATDLARAEGVRPQSMAKIIQALEAAGLVNGSADPNDGRKTLLELTEAAREEYRTGRRAREDWLTQAIAETLTPEEIEQLVQTTALFRRLAQSP